MIKRKPSQIPVSNDISKFINLVNAKAIVAILMIIFSIYHISIMLKLDNNSCKYLLRDGHFQSNYNWQPYGCMVHNYTTKDSHLCFNYVAFWGGKNKIVFLGDLYLHEFYQTLISHVSGNYVNQKFSNSKINSRLKYENSDLSLTGSFYDIRDFNSSLDGIVFQLKSTTHVRIKPILVVSFGLDIFNNSVNISAALKEYKKQLVEFSSWVEKLRGVKIIWMLLEYTFNENTPNLNDYITQSNALAIEYLKPKGVLIWQSNVKIYQQLSMVMRSSDDLYIRSLSTYWYTQIYLNLYCNDVMKFFDGTCCSKGEDVTTTQVVTFVYFLIWSVIALYCFLYDRFCLNSMNRNEYRKTTPFIPTHHRTGSDVLPINTSFFMSLYEISFANLKLGAILGYFFICDRTIFFMKENKAYTPISFLLPLCYVFIIGIFFSDTSQKCGILNRDITDEWKGWLQCVILVYHITGASKILPIYFIIRLCVSCYLFMTGFGHFTYFWTKGDISFRRLLIILYKLNFLTFCLCLTMNRAYQVYYFVPLVSVSFIMIYLIFALWPIHSDSSRMKCTVSLMFIKLLILIGAIAILHSYDKIFDKVFLTSPLRSLFIVSEDRPNDWKFRWSLDRYSVVIGMLYGLVYHTLKQNNMLFDNHNLNIFSNRTSYILFGFGISSILIYFLFAIFIGDKQIGIQIHPYISLISIFGYVIVRNCFGSVRKRFSIFFAWIGRISLEVYISQYHIWLAADAHGVLVLLPGYPILNLLLTTFVFFCISHELHNLTLIFMPYLIPDTCRGLARNLFLVLLILLPLGVVNGILVIF